MSGASSRMSIRPITAVVVACIVCGAVISARVLFQIPRVPDRHSDFVGYYVSATLLRTGASPYDPDAQRGMRPRLLGSGPDPDAVVYCFYPPWVVLAILPLTWLSVTTANLCWTLFQALGVGALCAYRLAKRLSPVQAGLVLSWVAVWLPTMVTLRFGQISLLLLLAFLGFADAVRRRRALSAGLWLACLSIKPTHMLAPIVLLAADRRWSALAVAATVLGVLIAITIGLFGVQLLDRYVDTLRLAADLQLSNPSWRTSTYSLAALTANASASRWLLLLLLDIATFVVWFAIHRRHGVGDAAATLPVVSILISPHVFVYDLVVSLAAVPALARRPAFAAVPLLAGGFVLVWIAHVVLGRPSLVVWWLIALLITTFAIPPQEGLT